MLGDERIRDRCRLLRGARNLNAAPDFWVLIPMHHAQRASASLIDWVDDNAKSKEADGVVRKGPALEANLTVGYVRITTLPWSFRTLLPGSPGLNAPAEVRRIERPAGREVSLRQGSQVDESTNPDSADERLGSRDGGDVPRDSLDQGSWRGS